MIILQKCPCKNYDFGVSGYLSFRKQSKIEFIEMIEPFLVELQEIPSMALTSFKCKVCKVVWIKENSLEDQKKRGKQLLFKATKDYYKDWIDEHVKKSSFRF